MVQTDPAELLKEGIAAARSGDKPRTRALLRQVTELDPQNELAWLWRANSAESPDEAVDCLRRTLGVNPNNENAKSALPDALVRAAAAYQADRPRAKRLLVEATTLAPRHELAWMWRAGLADTPEEGVKHLRTVLSINPNNAKAQAGLTKLQGQMAPQWRCPICEHADQNPQPMCPTCGCVLTLAMPEAFDVPRAIHRPAVETIAKKLYAAVREDQKPETVFALGMAYLNLGFTDEGVRTLQAAVRTPGADPNLRGQLTQFTNHRAALARRGLSETQAASVKPLVMVVDDSPTIRKLVAATLTAVGYRVLEAESGYAAADQIRENGTPAVFLLDVNMPGMDGFTLCKTLRGSPETAKVPVVFLTGKDGFLNKLRGQWAGAAEYLTKPFDPQKLLAVIGKLAPLPTVTASTTNLR
jgi:twitching motility two-component system response regulator PilG